MDILDKVKATIARHKMIEKGETVLVAVSGGPDSVALLDLLWRMRDDLALHLHVAHLHHGLRGGESDADADFVSHLASRYDLPLIIEQTDIAALRRKKGGTLEERARDARYRFLRKAAEGVNATKIATGHTADDRAETTLMWLLRGTGPTGLRSIPPVREGVIVRPLIDVTRAEVETYLKENGLPSRTDSSNLDKRHFRNRIRHELLPLLQKEFSPDFVRHTGRLADLMNSEEDFFDREVKRLWPGIVLRESGRKIVLDIQALSLYHIALKRRILRHVIRTLKKDVHDIHSVHVRLLLEALDSPKSGCIIDLPGDLVAERASDSLVIRLGKTVRFDRELIIPGVTDLPEIEGVLETRRILRPDLREDIRRGGPGTGFFDAGLLTGEIRVRSKRAGDGFQPLGMSGRKKLQDYFVDEKIPRLERQEIPLLTAGGEIAWIVGRRLSEKFKVTDSTNVMISIHFKRRG